MRKKTFLLSIFLIFGLVACTQTPVQVTPATTPGVSVSTATTEPLATETTGPAETATMEVGITPATTETPSTTEAPSTTETPAAEGTTTVETGTGTPAAEVTASPVVTGTAELPGTGEVDLGRASNLIGQQVADVNGQLAGEVQDLAINLVNRRVQYVILQVTNPDDQEVQSVPVPWAAFKFAPGAPVSLTVDNETLAGATTIDLKAVPVMIPSDWDDEFGAYWADIVGPTGEATPAPETTETPEAETGMEGIVLASDFIGKELQTPNGQSLGEMNDLILDQQTGEVTFVVLSAGEALGVGEKLVPIPLSVLNRNLETRIFTLPLDLSQLANAPNFDLSNLPNTTAQDWQDMLQNFWNQFLTP